MTLKIDHSTAQYIATHFPNGVTRAMALDWLEMHDKLFNADGTAKHINCQCKWCVALYETKEAR